MTVRINDGDPDLPEERATVPDKPNVSFVSSKFDKL